MSARGTKAGIAVDAEGGAVIDPTENVKDLMAASLDSLADLRKADKELSDAKMAHLKEMADLRAKHADQLRTSDLKAADKTREVDVMAAAASATALATAVSALQATSDRNTETLRNQVADTATKMAKQTSDTAVATQLQTDNLFRRVDERVAALERAAATGAGRAAVADPQLAEVIAELRGVTRSTDKGEGKSEGISAVWVAVIGAVGLVGGLLGIAGVIYAVLTRLQG